MARLGVRYPNRGILGRQEDSGENFCGLGRRRRYLHPRLKQADAAEVFASRAAISNSIIPNNSMVPMNVISTKLSRLQTLCSEAFVYGPGLAIAATVAMA